MSTTDNISILKEKAKELAGESADITVWENGRFLHAYIDKGIKQIRLGGRDGDDSNEHITEYYIMDTLHNTIKCLQIDAIKNLEYKTMGKTYADLVFYDKNGKPQNLAHLEINSVIDPTKKTEIQKLLTKVPQKPRFQSYKKMIEKFITKFENKGNIKDVFRRGIENALKLNASNILHRRKQRSY